MNRTPASCGRVPRPAVVAVVGDLDVASANDLDASKLSFCDSSGLHESLRLHQHAGGGPTALTIHQGPPQLAAMLTTGRLDGFFAEDDIQPMHLDSGRLLDLSWLKG